MAQALVTFGPGDNVLCTPKVDTLFLPWQKLGTPRGRPLPPTLHPFREGGFALATNLEKILESLGVNFNGVESEFLTRQGEQLLHGTSKNSVSCLCAVKCL